MHSKRERLLSILMVSLLLFYLKRALLLPNFRNVFLHQFAVFISCDELRSFLSAHLPKLEDKNVGEKIIIWKSRSVAAFTIQSWDAKSYPNGFWQQAPFCVGCPESEGTWAVPGLRCTEFIDFRLATTIVLWSFCFRFCIHRETHSGPVGFNASFRYSSMPSWAVAMSDLSSLLVLCPLRDHCGLICEWILGTRYRILGRTSVPPWEPVAISRR